MAKGAESKQIIFNKIAEIFPGAFMDDKVMRIPLQENGEPIEIKVTLTAAKDLLGAPASGSMTNKIDFTAGTAPIEPTKPVEITAEEKANVEKLVAALGI